MKKKFYAKTYEFKDTKYGDLYMYLDNEDIFLIRLADISRVWGIPEDQLMGHVFGDEVYSEYELCSHFFHESQEGKSFVSIYVLNELLYRIQDNDPAKKAYITWIKEEIIPDILCYEERKSLGGCMDCNLQKELHKCQEENISLHNLLQQLNERLKTVLTERDTILKEGISYLNQLRQYKDREALHQSICEVLPPCSIAHLAKMLTAAGFNVGRNKLFEKLRNYGFLTLNEVDRNIPTPKADNLGLFDVKYFGIHKDHEQYISPTSIRVTPKGILFFINYFLTKKGGKR